MFKIWPRVLPAVDGVAYFRGGLLPNALTNSVFEVTPAATLEAIGIAGNSPSFVIFSIAEYSVRGLRVVAVQLPNRQARNIWFAKESTALFMFALPRTAAALRGVSSPCRQLSIVNPRRDVPGAGA